MISAKEARELSLTCSPAGKSILEDIDKRIRAASAKGERKIRWEGPIKHLGTIRTLSNLGYDLYCDNINLGWAYAIIKW